MMRAFINFLKIKQVALLIIVIMIGVSITSCGGTWADSEASFSEYVVGSWSGQIDMAKFLYKGLGDELGVELSPESEYADVGIIFSEDGTFVLEFDKEGMASATGKCLEPYVSLLTGFDTDLLVELIMQEAVKDMPDDTTRIEGEYVLDNDNYIITLINSDASDDGVMYLDNDGNLQLEDESIGQTLIFKKIAGY